MIYKINLFGMCFILSVKSKIENIDDESDIENNYKFGINNYIENMKYELDKVNQENRELWSIILHKHVNSSGLYGM